MWNDSPLDKFVFVFLPMLGAITFVSTIIACIVYLIKHLRWI